MPQIRITTNMIWNVVLSRYDPCPKYVKPDINSGELFEYTCPSTDDKFYFVETVYGQRKVPKEHSEFKI